MNYWLLLVYKYIPIFRPKWLHIEGNFIFNRRTKILVSGNSLIHVSGHADFSNSTITLHESEWRSESFVCHHSDIKAHNAIIKLGQHAHFKSAQVECKHASIKTADHFRVHHYRIEMESSQMTTENYCLFDGDTSSVLYMRSGTLITGENVRIQAHVVLSGGTMSIGNHSFVNRYTQVNCCDKIAIGDYVMISYHCFISDNNSHSTDYRQRRAEIDAGFPNGTLPDKTTVAHAPIVIADDVWIGTRSIVLKGVHIGAQSIVAAGTTIVHDVESAMLAFNQSTKTIKQ